MKKNYFLVYNNEFEIQKTFEYWGNAIMNYLDEHPSLMWINTGQADCEELTLILTHINEVNKTNY